jgi:maltose/moltooligosaccharide transporter
MKEKLSTSERRLFFLLGTPSVGLSLSLTVVSTYLPVLARRFTSSRTIIGALIGGEGLIALLVPLWVGGLSDRLDTRFGRRLPFLMVTAPAGALAIGAIPFAPSLVTMAVSVFFFYLAYFTYLAPYRALYADVVPRRTSGRAQGIQGAFSQIGTGAALVGGGLLLHLWRPLPYLVAAAALLLGTAVLVPGLIGSARLRAPPEGRRRSPPAEVWALVRDHRDIRCFSIANALVSLSISGLKAFVVLWLIEGLGKTMPFTAGAMAVVAVSSIVGGLAAGKLADRYGTARVLEGALLAFGLGLALPTFSNSTLVLGAALPLIALCGGAATVLPYALLMRLMTAEHHGAAAGLFDVSGGLGTLLGPAIAGLAIDLLAPLFESTQGYAAMWPVVSISAIGGAVLLRRVRT